MDRLSSGEFRTKQLALTWLKTVAIRKGLSGSCELIVAVTWRAFSITVSRWYIALTQKVCVYIILYTSGLPIFADAAYVNVRKFKSIIGYCALISEAPVTWTSCRQLNRSLRANIIALTDAAKQAVWLCHFLYTVEKLEVYKKKATVIYGDNKGALKLKANPVFHSWTSKSRSGTMLF